MTAVADILKSKADLVVHTIGPDDSVFDALQRMADKSLARCWCCRARRLPAS